MGKLSTENLKRLLDCIRNDPTVIVPPLAGFDSGVHMIDDKYLVVSTDPCIGVPKEWFGWLLINYAASDVALFGAKPQYCTINLLGPISTRTDSFFRMMNQACEAADELGMAIVTGHTGTYEDLSAPVGVCTAYGIVEKRGLITPGGVKPGDELLCLKPVGLETVVNFALKRKAKADSLFGVRKTQQLSKLVRGQSCVNEALLLAGLDGVHAMHDATEGGLAAAANEMAEASQTGFRISYEKIPFHEQMFALQKAFGFSVLQMLSVSSTGTVLAAVAHEKSEEIQAVLHSSNIPSNVIGSFTECRKRILVKARTEAAFPKEPKDPYPTIMR